jgi:hypothetical protein
VREPGNSDSDDLVQWLMEAGRRRAPQPRPPAGEPAPPPEPAVRSRPRSPRQLFLGALASLAYLQYFYVGVFLEIARLPALIVFVPVH